MVPAPRLIRDQLNLASFVVGEPGNENLVQPLGYDILPLPGPNEEVLPENIDKGGFLFLQDGEGKFVIITRDEDGGLRLSIIDLPVFFNGEICRILEMGNVPHIVVIDQDMRDFLVYNMVTKVLIGRWQLRFPLNGDLIHYEAKAANGVPNGIVFYIPNGESVTVILDDDLGNPVAIPFNPVVAPHVPVGAPVAH